MNNVKNNLMFVASANRKSTSKFFGVDYHDSRKSWRARIYLPGDGHKCFNFGFFNEENVAAAYPAVAAIMACPGITVVNIDEIAFTQAIVDETFERVKGHMGWVEIPPNAKTVLDQLMN